MLNRFALLLLATIPAQAQLTPNPNFHDTAVIPAFQAREPGIVHFTRILRTPVTDDLDLLAVRGGKPSGGWRDPGDLRWMRDSGDDLLGVFLADRHDLNLVYELAIVAPARFGGVIEPRQIDANSFTYEVVGEKGGGPWGTFFYDIRSKRLIGRHEYQPFVVGARVVSDGEIYLIAANGEQRIALQPTTTGFELVSASKASALVARAGWGVDRSQRVWTSESESFDGLVLRRHSRPGFEQLSPAVVEKTTKGEKEYRFEVSTREKWQRLRPDLAARTGGPYHIEEEEIGPHQVFEGKLWFGKTFYDGEGYTGVGGFGYFDPATRQFELIEIPEVADYSVSALLVEEDALWMGLEQRGEWGPNPGGLLRWDRRTREAEKIAEPTVIRVIARCGDRLCLGEKAGPAFFDDGQWRRFAIVARRGGGWRIAPRLETATDSP